MKFALAALCLIITLPLMADTLSGIDPFYYDYNPRMAAMGGAGSALQDNIPSACLANPAALALLDYKYSFQAANSSFLNLISYNYLGTALRTKKGSVFSFAFDFCGDDALSEYEMCSSWSAPASIILPRSKFLNNFLLGVNLKIIALTYGNNNDGEYIDNNGLNHQVEGDAFGYAAEWGCQFAVNENNRLSLFNRNLLNHTFYNSANETNTALGSYSESRPVNLIIAYAYHSHNTIIALDFQKSLYQDGNDILKTGVEVNIMKDKIALRSGWSARLFSFKDSRFNIGCGFRFQQIKDFRLDIAYSIISQWQSHNNLLISLSLFIP